MSKMLTHALLRKALTYDPSTGLFHWLIAPSHRAKPGDAAGCVRSDGYARIQLFGKKYLAHRLAWFYVMGEWPSAEVDHEDGDGSNNRWRNLRLATRRVNMQNQRRARRDNSTGLLGATAVGNRFQATINVDGAPRYLGCYGTPQAAHEAYVNAKRQHHAGCTI